MKLLIVIFTVAVYFTFIVHSQSQLLHCHRCFGNGYCNNASDAGFTTNVRNATCNITSLLDFEIQNPLMKQIQERINKQMLDGLNAGAEYNASNATPRAQCLTATVFEPHDTHTIRTCVITRINGTLCGAIENAIQPVNWYNGTFACQECTNDFCNNQTLITATNGTTPGSGSGSPRMVSSSITLFMAMAMMSLFLLH